MMPWLHGDQPRVLCTKPGQTNLKCIQGTVSVMNEAMKTIKQAPPRMSAIRPATRIYRAALAWQLPPRQRKQHFFWLLLRHCKPASWDFLLAGTVEHRHFRFKCLLNQQKIYRNETSLCASLWRLGVGRRKRLGGSSLKATPRIGNVVCYGACGKPCSIRRLLYLEDPRWYHKSSIHPIGGELPWEELLQGVYTCNGYIKLV